jgi:hypothetical protein
MSETIVATYADHGAAEEAVRKLADAGFAMKSLSILGKGYHTEENVTGFYSYGDRVKLWGSRGAVWGGLWGLFFGGMFLTLPVTGPVVVLGALAAAVVGALESAVLVGGVGALAAALYGMGVAKDEVIAYEAVIKADGFLVMAHGAGDDMARARAVLGTSGAPAIAVHSALPAPV